MQTVKRECENKEQAFTEDGGNGVSLFNGFRPFLFLPANGYLPENFGALC